MTKIEAAIIASATLLGFTSLKEEQKFCIKVFLEGNDVFVMLPTGFGKTVCFTCLPYAFVLLQKRPEMKSVIIVISPLIALICDQVADLLLHNVSAGYLDSQSTSDVKKKVVSGKYSILFMSPKQLVDKWRFLFSSSVYNDRLIGLVVDEAQCVVKWYATMNNSKLHCMYTKLL